MDIESHLAASDPHVRALGLALCLAALSLLGSCAASQPVTGSPRPAVLASQVQIYLQPPASKYEHMADLSASSKGSFRFSAAGKMDAVIDRLKVQAARLGANGILLHGVGDQSAGSIGAGISTETNNPHTAYGLGFGASTFLSRKVGDAEAIYVESPAPSSAAH
jgi:hypothetical protein